MANGPTGYPLGSPGHSPDDPPAESLLSQPWKTSPHSEITAEDDLRLSTHSSNGANCGLPGPSGGSRWQESSNHTGAVSSWFQDCGVANTSRGANGSLEAAGKENGTSSAWRGGSERGPATRGLDNWTTIRGDEEGVAKEERTSWVHPHLDKTRFCSNFFVENGDAAFAAGSSGTASDGVENSSQDEVMVVGQSHRDAAAAAANGGMQKGFFITRRRTATNPGV